MEQQNRSYLKLIPVLAFFISVGSLWYGNRSQPHPTEIRFSQVQEEPVPPPPPMDTFGTKSLERIKPLAIPTPAPAPATAPATSSNYGEFWAKYSISMGVLIGAFSMIFLKKRFSAGDLKWAYAMIGTVVGFWLR